MIKKRILLVFFLMVFGCQGMLYAQVNPDDIALNDDALEGDFYEALKQRAIENYDKAIIAIDKCIDKKGDEAAFYYELGKNQLDLKQYAEAEQAFQKAVDLNPNERWYWNGLYDVYYQTKNFEKSIPIVKKLIAFDVNMNEDLVSLYMYTNQHEKALELIKEMQKKMVLSEMMEYYRLKIENSKNTTQFHAENFEKAIKEDPKNEQNYINLMLYYSSNNQEDKAFEVAQKLAKQIPESEWAHINLFKYYLQENQGENAVNSMFKVFNNANIDIKIKHRILNEFLIYVVKTNSFYNELEQAVDYFQEDKTVNVAKEIAKFFYNKSNFDQTTFYLEKALANNPNDFESVTLLLDNYVNAKNYDALANRSEIFIDLYPSQPKIYYYAGFANNQIKKHKKAISFLENGLEFVVDNVDLEVHFNVQLAEAYRELGDETKSKLYFARAEELYNKRK